MRLAQIALLLTLVGCGSIINGTTQPISFSSTPAAARVSINGVEYGNTPVTVPLPRKGSHAVVLKLDGYEPYSINLTRGVSGWVWGNLVFGGLIGLAVDAGTGGMYKLTPEQVNSTLNVQKATNGLFVIVLMRPLEGAEKVGQLTRE